MCVGLGKGWKQLLFVLLLSGFCSVIVNRLCFSNTHADVVILSTDTFLTVSTRHLMTLRDEKREDSKRQDTHWKNKCRPSIHFVRLNGPLVETKGGKGFNLVIFKVRRQFRRRGAILWNAQSVELFF